MKRRYRIVAYCMLAVLVVGMALFGLHVCADHDHDHCPICAVLGAVGLVSIASFAVVFARVAARVLRRGYASPEAHLVLAHIRLNC